MDFSGRMKVSVVIAVEDDVISDVLCDLKIAHQSTVLLLSGDNLPTSIIIHVI